MSIIDYEKYPQFNAEYLENIRLIKEKYGKKDEKLFVLKIHSKRIVQYYHDKLDRVFEPNNATPLNEKFAKSLQKQFTLKTELIEIK